MKTTIWVVNFEELKFLWILWLRAIYTRKHDDITAQGINKNSTDP